MSGTTPASGRPAAGPVRPYSFPRFVQRLLSNGVRLIVAPMHALPIVTVHVLTDAGATQDPPGREGLAMLTAELLAEGTASVAGAALVDRFEQLGTALTTGADWDSSWCESTVLAPRLESLLALLAEVIQAPAFTQREVERLAAQRLAELLEQRAEPRGLADDMFARFAYAPAARFATPAGGSETSVAAITRDEVVAFHAARMTPASATIVIAGDVTVDAGAQLVAGLFGGWRAGGATLPPRRASVAEREGTPETAGVAPDAKPASAGEVLIVAKADAPQSEIRVGHVAIPRSHPDWLPVHVMNAILGGLFSSRINLNLRERHAYTYGAFSSIDARRHAGTFEVSTAVESEVTAPAVREILLEIDRMRAAAATADELSLATAYLEGVFPIRYETTAAVAGALANLVIFDLPHDHYDTYRARVRALSTEDVWRVAREQLRPAETRIVVVGDPMKIAEPLAALGAGPVRTWSAEGVPGG